MVFDASFAQVEKKFRLETNSIALCAAIGSSFLTAKFVTLNPLGNSVFQLFLVLITGASYSYLIGKLFPLESKFAHLPVVVHCLAWGRQVFIGFFFYDDWGYFHTIGHSLTYNIQTLFEPLNEHFQPLQRLIHWVIYNSFGTNYFGIAAVSFAAFILLLHAFYWLLVTLKFGARLSTWVVSMLAAWPGIGEVLVWKSAGIPLFLTTAFFFWWLTLSLRAIESKEPTKAADYGKILLTNFLFTFTSSLICNGWIFLFPLAGIRSLNKQGWKKLLLIVSLSLLMSIFYFLLRSQFSTIPIPHRIQVLSYLKLIGAFVTAEIFSIAPATGSQTMGIVFLMGAAVFFGYTYIRRSAAASFSVLLGTMIVTFSILQFYLFRADILDSVNGSRHYFFPILGLLLLIAAALNEIRRSHWLSLEGIKIGSVILLSLFVVRQTYFRRHFIPVDELRGVSSAQIEFTDDIRKMLCSLHPLYRVVVIPDLSMETISNYKQIRLSYPFDAEIYGFTFSYYAKTVMTSCANFQRIHFLPLRRMDKEEVELLRRYPQVISFYRKYFPTSFPAE